MKYFRHIEDDGEGSISFPAASGKHGQSLISLLYLEASIATPGSYDIKNVDRIPLAHCDEVVGAIQMSVAATAHNWIDSALDDIPMAAQNRSAFRKALAFNDHDAGISGPMAALQCSPIAVQIIYDTLNANNIVVPDHVGPISHGRAMAIYGLYFMDCYIDEVIASGNPATHYQLREIHLQQAGEALSIATLNRAADEVDEHSAQQKRDAAKARHRQRYGPLNRAATQLFDKGTWKSTRQAAIAITPQIERLAREQSLYLSKDRAQTTVYEWLLAHAKRGQ